MRWIIISLLVFVFGLFNVYSPVRKVAQTILSPLQISLRQSAQNVRAPVDFLFHLRKVSEQNEELQNEMDIFRSRLVHMDEIEKENMLFREQLGIDRVVYSGRLVYARVFGNPLDISGSSISLDVGSDQGVKEGDVVIRGRYLIGIIIKVFERRSLANLVTSPSLSVSVVDMETGTEGISKGKYGTSIEMDRILPGESVNPGDLVISSGRDGMFPQGYIVGEVTSEAASSSSVLNIVPVRILVDLEGISGVFVIVK